MKWDDGNRKTNKTTNWSEKCYVGVRAPREALLSRRVVGAGLLRAIVIAVINTASVSVT